MESKKSEKADLEGKRFIFLEIGFIVALLITFAAFSWKSPEREFSGFFTSSGAEISEEQIPVTRQQSPPPPPPPVDAFELNIVDDRVELEEQTVFADVETDPDQEFDFSGISGFEEELTEEAFFIVQEMPKFMGRDYNTFSGWIQRNVVYPQSAVQKGLSGKIIVHFEVNTSGKLENIVILQGLSPELDQEVLNVVKSSEGMWTPGSNRGRPVRVQFNFPVNFVL